MAPISSAARKSVPHVSLDEIRPTTVKADLAPSDSVRLPEGAGPSLGEVALDALIAYYGSLKALTLEIGETDPSFVKREILAAKFNRLAPIDAGAKAALSRAMNTAYEPLSTPDIRALQTIARIVALMEELRQYAEFNASKRIA